MEPIQPKTPTNIGNIEVHLKDLVILPDSGPPQRAEFRIQVLDQDGRPARSWLRTGDLVPYLDDSSTYLTTADKTYLIDLLDRIRQEAHLRIIGE